jgi:hypothetical protein
VGFFLSSFGARRSFVDIFFLKREGLGRAVASRVKITQKAAFAGRWAAAAQNCFSTGETRFR